MYAPEEESNSCTLHMLDAHACLPSTAGPANPPKSPLPVDHSHMQRVRCMPFGERRHIVC